MLFPFLDNQESLKNGKSKLPIQVQTCKSGYNDDMNPTDPLARFLPPVRAWFRAHLGEPTAAQLLGWPAIASGKNTLILAPTGSGKTLAAFLACLDQLWRQDPLQPGVQVLYISPLKALNNDIYRNLQVPLEGVAREAQRQGLPLPALEIGLRTGDTPPAERQRLLRRPPQVLITTPESLHLLLTSRARESLRRVTHCIVDEIHSLCPNKRGVFLSLLLERLEALTPTSFLRIGLSATQRPLDEVARFLGGADGNLNPRPVTIVDAGLRKKLDLQVVSPVEHFGAMPEKSVWPAIYRLLGQEIHNHRSTLVFANNRRTVERITAHLNNPEPGVSGSAAMIAPEESEADEDLARAHHGSISLEVRQQTEEALKEGRLKAVVATASLELGIDMGAVDLVCQVESPGSVARGLQRVGRAGHLVGQQSKGRLIPKTQADLLEQAVLAREMAAGRVEAITVPHNCLDVLAQQIIAMVAMEEWEVPALYSLIRRAYPFRDLSPQLFETVLEMVSGRYRFAHSPPVPLPHGESGEYQISMAALQARISWDRVRNRLAPLPGTRHLALVSGGAIPDTGQYAAYTTSGLRIGELDEEFIYERRVGDVFLLGTNAWRLEHIEADRVIVAPAEGMPAMIPFWRGEQAGRSGDLGQALGAFLRELGGKIDSPECGEWLQQECCLDAAASRNLRKHVLRQLTQGGVLPSDQTFLVEAFRDPLGDWQMVILSPWGHRFNLTLRFALEARLTQRLGYRPQCFHHDDGVLLRLADTDEPPLNILDGITPEKLEALILPELGDSALFALRFRQNAARALLLPRLQPGKRAPLWLQRLRGRDLLQVARRHPDFPIVAETFRECLQDHLDVSRFKSILADIQTGKIQVITRRADAPSPFAAGLLFSFTAAQMYQEERDARGQEQPAGLDQKLLDQLVAPDRHGHLLDPRAIQKVERRLRGMGLPPRTIPEMAEWLRRLGDLSLSDLEGPMINFLSEMEQNGQAKLIDLPRCREHARWILMEEQELYFQAFSCNRGPTGSADDESPALPPSSSNQAAETILRRFLETHALVSLQDIVDRYPFDSEWVKRQLDSWSAKGWAVPVRPDPSQDACQWSVAENWQQVQKTTTAILRREIVSCRPQHFADFLLRWQGVAPFSSARGDLADPLSRVLPKLEGYPLPWELWEQAILPGRLPGYLPSWLDERIGSGAWTWVAHQKGEGGADLLSLWNRENLIRLSPPCPSHSLDPNAGATFEALRAQGASFVTDLASSTKLSPSLVRAALWTLAGQGLVTNDHLDVVRRKTSVKPGEESPGSRRALRAMRRPASTRPEGRWSLIKWGRSEPEQQALFMARLLLDRYGIAARELALLDPGMPPWRILYEVLSRLELAGDVRRGYFVEGLSGAQFALPEAARLLHDPPASTANTPLILLHSLDPANLYGAGAPFDLPLLDEGSQSFTRRLGNWLVLRTGLPILFIEGNRQRLTTLPSASRADIQAAVAFLPTILERDLGMKGRHKLTIKEWNGQGVTGGEGGEYLAAAGFVRDYQSLTLYSAYR